MATLTQAGIGMARKRLCALRSIWRSSHAGCRYQSFDCAAAERGVDYFHLDIMQRFDRRGQRDRQPAGGALPENGQVSVAVKQAAE
jgi:hypothetical protein